jgi:hypothetical protein
MELMQSNPKMKLLPRDADLPAPSGSGGIEKYLEVED